MTNDVARMPERIELAHGWHLQLVEYGGDHAGVEYEYIICDPNGDRLGGTTKHCREFAAAMQAVTPSKDAVEVTIGEEAVVLWKKLQGSDAIHGPAAIQQALESYAQQVKAVTPSPTDERVSEAINQLTNHQQQADFDGVMVTVSRQALDEVLDYIAKSRQSLAVPMSVTLEQAAAAVWGRVQPVYYAGKVSPQTYKDAAFNAVKKDIQAYAEQVAIQKVQAATDTWKAIADGKQLVIEQLERQLADGAQQAKPLRKTLENIQHNAAEKIMGANINTEVGRAIVWALNGIEQDANADLTTAPVQTPAGIPQMAIDTRQSMAAADITERDAAELDKVLAVQTPAEEGKNN